MLGKLISHKTEGNEVKLTFEKGEAALRVLTPEIINVFLPRETKDHRSKAIEGEKAQKVTFTVKQEGEVLVVATEKLAAKVYDDFYVDFYKADGTLLCEDDRQGRIFTRQISERFIEVLKAEGHEVPEASDFHYPVEVVKKMQGDEKFYGLGDKTGFLNKRDYEYENWNSDIPQAHTEDYRALYKSIPFLITLSGNGVYGLFFDNTYKSYLNLGKENEGYFYYGAEAGNLDYYMIAGEKMTDVVCGYTYLTGRTPLPQLWTLGYHQSRWGYESAEDIREVAEKYRELKIPCDTIHFDIDYMDGYRVFTWNNKEFGEPGAIIAEIAEKGFKTVCIIDPGVYFAMNSPMAVLAPAGTADVVASAAQVVSSWGFSITPDTLNQIASEVGEQSIISRAGGAPTLAVGMAYILHGALGGMMDVAFWYHFAILFEALFILTAVDAGTRAARFMLQDLLGVVSPGLKRTDSLPANLLATALCVLAWGYFLHQGVVDPLGGINTLWPLFGIANQMLAGMALMLCAVVLFKMKRQRYAWVALVPTAWLLICTLTAGWQKAFSPDAKVGFLAIANKFQAMIDSGNIPSQYTESQLAQLVFNNRLDAGLTIFFMVVVVVLALFSIKTALAALKDPKPTAKETPYEPMPENVEEIVAQAKGAH